MRTDNTSVFSVRNKYDGLFSKWTKHYFTFLDYRYIKAQAIAESNLNPRAQSPVGARGLMQFMPSTWDEVRRELKFPPTASAEDTNYSIQAGAYYNRKLYRSWSANRPIKDKLQLMFASYNAGFGNILKAQSKCGGASLYADIIRCLPDVTGRYSKETIEYVVRIERIYKKLLF